MDLFLRLSDTTKSLLHLTGDALIGQINRIHGKKNKETVLNTILQIPKSELSAEWVKNLENKRVDYIQINNPYNKWTRQGRIFNKGNFRRRFPPESDLNTTYASDSVAYTTYGYNGNGSNATVKTLVAYNGHLSIIKRSEDIDNILYEIIIQAYLFEQLSNRAKKGDNYYKYICVPEIFFVQRARENAVDICMHRAVGTDLGQLSGTQLMIALAHVCKGLWHLQRDFHFMHRDLSPTNVFYDQVSKKVTFIDFGYSCVNPRPFRKQSWQSGDESFYTPSDNNHASMCTNMSLDICILIAVLSHWNNPWCREEHQRMKRVMKKTIDASKNEIAKSKLKLQPTLRTDIQEINASDASETDKRRLCSKKIRKAIQKQQSYTAIDYGENWFPGNMLEVSAAPHWWLYNMVEFPIEQWYPANVLSRLLYHIPILDWFAIRKNWTLRFDEEMPKDIRIKIKSDASTIPNVPVFEDGVVKLVDIEIANQTGTLIKLFSTNQFKIKLDKQKIQVNVFTRLCNRIF